MIWLTFCDPADILMATRLTVNKEAKRQLRLHELSEMQLYAARSRRYLPRTFRAWTLSPTGIHYIKNQGSDGMEVWINSAI